jgi:hypothetical protein
MTRLGDISENRGTEEIPVLVDCEVQHWMAGALEGPKLASGLVRERIAKIGTQHAGRDGEEGRDKQGCPSPAARKARHTVLDAARGDRISDSQMERLVKLALGKTTYPKVRDGKAAEAPARHLILLLATDPRGGWTRRRRPKSALPGWSRRGLSRQETRHSPQESRGVRGPAGKKQPRRRWR